MIEKSVAKAPRSAYKKHPVRALGVINIQKQLSPYFNPTYTRTGWIDRWIGQPPVLDRHEVVTDNGEVDTLRQATP